MLYHLWVGRPPPFDYIELILCRDVFHCLPSELAEQDGITMMKMLLMMNQEALVQKRRGK